MRWKEAAGLTTFASVGWTRVTSSQARVSGWGKSTTELSAKISTRSALFRSDRIDTSPARYTVQLALIVRRSLHVRAAIWSDRFSRQQLISVWMCFREAVLVS